MQMMWQKKENGGQENLSIEEYLVRRKNIRQENPAGRQGLILPENRQWIFAELNM